MHLTDRRARYAAIEAHRGRPLLVYATSTRHGVSAMMAGDAVREFVDQIDAIDADAAGGTGAVDVLIHSTGGDPLAAWKLMSVLRERFASVAVLVPSTAFSAATIFAMGADEIVLHPHASLGPIDPQITITQPDGGKRTFAFEDVGAFLRFVSGEAGLTEQAHLTGIIDKLFSVVDPVHVGAAKRASELSTEIGARLLRTHMTRKEDAGKARTIAERMNKRFYAHADAVSRSRARALQLKVAPDDPTLERLIWSAFLGLETHLALRTPWVPLHHFLARGGAPAVESVAHPAPLRLPPDTPPDVAKQAWTDAVEAAKQGASRPAVTVEYELINAVVESTRAASQHATRGTLSGTRTKEGDVKVKTLDHFSGWESVGNDSSATSN